MLLYYLKLVYFRYYNKTLFFATHVAYNVNGWIKLTVTNMKTVMD